MKTITGAIRPRRGKSTNDSSGTPSSPTRQTAFTLGKTPSKLSAGDELGIPFARFKTTSSATTADSATANEEAASSTMASIGQDEGVIFGNMLLTSPREPPDSNHHHHLPTGATTATGSVTPAVFEGGDYQQPPPSLYGGSAPIMSIVRRRRDVVHLDDPPSSTEQAQQKKATSAGPPAAEARGGILSYVHRLPIHIWGFSKHTDRTAHSEPPPVVRTQDSPSNSGWPDSPYQQRQRQPYKDPQVSPTHAASIHSESVVEPSNASFFSGDYGLLKRVSSTPGNLSLFRAHLVDPFRHPEFRAPPRYTRHQPIRLPTNEPDATPFYGYALLALTSVLFIFSMYSLVVSKFMPDTGVAFLDTVKEDRYFCLLMPITGLSFTFAVFWNWLGMKFFRHN